MDYFQGVVTEYLRAKRTQFVNTEYLINLDYDGTYLKGRHWYCDAVAIDFSDSTVHLCEVTYSRTLQAVINRLQAWRNEWPFVVKAIYRDSQLQGQWTVTPRVFIPEFLHTAFESKYTQMTGFSKTSPSMPKPIVTMLEDVLPWKYRSWNGKAY